MPIDPKDPRNAPFYAPRQQTFEVVCLKDDVSEGESLPEHYKRVSVQADSTYVATQSPKVAEEAKGYRVLFAALPGQLTQPELLAQQRQTISKSGGRHPMDTQPVTR